MGDIIVIAVLTIIVSLIIYNMWKNRGKSSCSGDCGNCGSSCNHIDWNQVKEEIHTK